MELREYMSIRRAYNLVRQEMDASRRLTFQELAVLCRLVNTEAGLKTSEIASYQGCLRPTMTHRTKHLEQLGLIDRVRGDYDRRNVVCTVTRLGREYVKELCQKTCGGIATGHSLARTTPERICRYVDAMGCLECDAGELVLLGLLVSEEKPCTISHLVDMLGFLQPTVSMSISALEEEGHVKRVDIEGRRAQGVELSESGTAIAEQVREKISEIIVRRRSRTAR